MLKIAYSCHLRRRQAAIISTSQERADGIVAALQPQRGFTDDESQADGGQVNIYAGGSDTEFADRLRAFLTEVKGVEVGDLGLAFDRVLYVPAYASRRMLEHEYHHQRQEPSNGSSSRSRGLSMREPAPAPPPPRHLVALRDPAQPAVPVTHLEHGKRYLLYLRGFAPHAALRLRAVGAQDWRGRALEFWPLVNDEDDGAKATDANGELKVGCGFSCAVWWCEMVVET